MENKEIQIEGLEELFEDFEKSKMELLALIRLQSQREYLFAELKEMMIPKFMQ